MMTYLDLSGFRRGVGAALVVCLSLLSQPGFAATQTDSLTLVNIDAIAESLKVKVKINSNGMDGRCVPDVASQLVAPYCYLGKMSLSAPKGLPAKGWTIYFNIAQAITQVTQGPFTIEIVNGDLYTLRPRPEFEGLAPGASASTSFRGTGLMLNQGQIHPNMFIADDNGAAALIASTLPKLEPQTGLEQQPYIAPMAPTVKAYYTALNGGSPPPPLATSLFAENQAVVFNPEAGDIGIIPTPTSIKRVGGVAARVDLSGGIEIIFKAVKISSLSLNPALDRIRKLGVSIHSGGLPVIITLDPSAKLKAEEYYLKTTPGEILVRAKSDAGAVYALTSLAALITPGRLDIAAVEIDDAPRFAFRGQQLDVSRNFRPLSFVLSLLDQMAAYKMNKLTLHLADDEGWRLEIAGLPELIGIGARRCYDPGEQRCLLPQLGSGPNGQGSGSDGFYTAEDYKAILTAAAARNIEIIPAIDVPGHARAAVKSMEDRYRRLAGLGKIKEAVASRLIDPDNTTVYRSVQGFDDNTVNPCIPSTYNFIDKVVTDIARLHKEAGVPLHRFMLGGDEAPKAWTDSPACAAFLQTKSGQQVGGVDGLLGYFIERVANMIAAKSIIPVAWDDGLQQVVADKMPTQVQSDDWGGMSSGGAEIAFEQKTVGWDVVIATYEALYFDAPYSTDPREVGNFWTYPTVGTYRVFSFMPTNLGALAEIWTNGFGQDFEISDPGTDAVPGDFFGIQGQLWSEMVRTSTYAEHQLYPRFLALAERAWHVPDWVPPRSAKPKTYDHSTHSFTPKMREEKARDWSRFVSIMCTKSLPNFNLDGIAYRLPLPGAVIKGGQLHANAVFPCLPIEYREKGGKWTSYTQPVTVKLPVAVRTMQIGTRRSGQTLVVLGGVDPPPKKWSTVIIRKTEDLGCRISDRSQRKLSRNYGKLKFCRGKACPALMRSEKYA